VSTYKQPSRINVVSILFLAAGVGAVYGAWKFGPLYWRDRQIKGKLEEAGNRFWKDRTVPGIEFAIRDELTTQIRAMGVDDPGLVISVERTPERLRIEAAYTVIVEHPGRKITRLRFTPDFETDAKSSFD
jgi:hypothetical protein